MTKSNSILVLIIPLMVSLSLHSEHWGRLNGITNKSRFKVTVQTSEKKGETARIVLRDGSEPETQDQEFDVKTIKSMNLVAPENGWDGDATIHVRVYRPDKPQQADITDRNGHIYIRDRNKNADIHVLDKYYCSSKDVQGICDYKERGGGADETFQLVVDNEGNIVFNR